MNRILTANLEEFVSQYSFSTEKDVDKFEYFAGYCYLAKYRPNDTVTREDLLSIHTGEGNDWGIDNIIILINDHLVINKEDFNEFLKYNSSLRVKIILVQAKTSSSISVAELGNFLKGSRDILKYINGEREHLPAANQKLKDKLEILDRIYEKAAQFDRDGNFNRPRLHLYYVTGGGTKNNTDVDSAIADNKRSLESFNLVDDIQTEIITATEICDLYQSTKRRLTCELLVEYNRENETSTIPKRNEQIFSFFASFFLCSISTLKHQLKAD